MKNFKLILKSLVSNNSAIDGARKKPWYFAIILFFSSLVLSLVPIGVTELKQHLDKSFDETTYYTREAVTEFAASIKDTGLMYVVHDEENKHHTLQATTGINKTIPFEAGKTAPFKFAYTTNELSETLRNSDDMKNTSYFIFTEDSLFIKIVNPNKPEETAIDETYCKNAYKKVGEAEIVNSYEEVLNEDGTVNITKTRQKTWENWKILIRKFHRDTRLASAGMQVLVMAAVDVLITLILGFMVWILTRGKQNAYRLFTVWECFKIAFWTTLSPALLTLGFGFLFKGFARTLFPLLVGIRVMWLSMKSLRPDGSGYAAE